jgi:hypothetical protein
MSEPRKKPRKPPREPEACPSPPDPDDEEAPRAEPECDKPKAEGDRGLDGFK